MGGGFVLVGSVNTTLSSFAYLGVNAYIAGGLVITKTEIVDDFYVKYATAAFQSVAFNIGTGITSWGTFSSDFSNGGGSNSFAIYGDTDSALTPSNTATYTSSETITSGSVVTIATAAYATVVDSYGREVSTNTPTLASFTVGYNEGSPIRTPSLYHDGRYWFPVAISSTANTQALVMDRNGDWHPQSLAMRGQVVYGNSHLFSNSQGIYEYGIGYNDNGTDITSYYETGDFAPSGTDKKSFYQSVFLTTLNSGNLLSTAYKIDGYNSPYSLSDFTMNTDLGTQNFKLPFPSTQLMQGKNISFKFSSTGDERWGLLNANLYYISDIYESD